MSQHGPSRPHRVSHWPPLPPRPADGHKGTFGRVLILGGQATMLGAPLLASRAALLSGSGLVQVVVPALNLPSTLAAQPELLGGTQEDSIALDAAIAAADVIVFGPGIGVRAEAQDWLDRVLAVGKPTVIDADGLNMLAGRERWTGLPVHCVLTPHPGEMGRLLRHLPGNHSVPADDPGRAALACLAAEHWGCTLLLKGPRTVVASPDPARYAVNPTGSVSLAKGGTGDVLSGIIGSLMGQGMAATDAAACGAWVHGRAGELAGAMSGARSVVASDVIAKLPGAFHEYSSRFG